MVINLESDENCISLAYRELSYRTLGKGWRSHYLHQAIGLQHSCISVLDIHPGMPDFIISCPGGHRRTMPSSLETHSVLGSASQLDVQPLDTRELRTTRSHCMELKP